MNKPLIEQQLEDRLTLLDASTEDSHLVPDLPLRDFLVALCVLTAAIVVLTWWAY